MTQAKRDERKIDKKRRQLAKRRATIERHEHIRAELERIKEIEGCQFLIDDALEVTKRLLPDHYNTLFGERSAGSKWGFELTPDHLSIGDWEMTGGSSDGLWIYQKVTEHTFTLGVQPLGGTDPRSIHIREGSHGPELVMNDRRGAPQTNIMTVIIGIENTYVEERGVPVRVVFTIHPGEPTPPHNCTTVEELQMKLDNDELDLKTSVKFL